MPSMKHSRAELQLRPLEVYDVDQISSRGAPPLATVATMTSKRNINVCTVVDWSNVFIGLRQTLLACNCNDPSANTGLKTASTNDHLNKTCYDILKERNHDLILLSILGDMQTQMHLLFGENFKLNFNEKHIVGNELLQDYARRTPYEQAGYKVSYLHRANVPVVDDMWRRRVLKEQGVDEAMLNICRKFLLKLPSKGEDGKILVILSADMAPMPCDEQGFPGVIAQAEMHNVLVCVSSWRIGQGAGWKKLFSQYRNLHPFGYDLDNSLHHVCPTTCKISQMTKTLDNEGPVKHAKEGTPLHPIII